MFSIIGDGAPLDVLQLVDLLYYDDDKDNVQHVQLLLGVESRIKIL